jgi:hypothetical protein
MGPSQRQEAVKALQKSGLSQREACKIMRARRHSSNEKPSLKALEDAPLIKRITELAQTYPRRGCKRLHDRYEAEAREDDPYMNFKRFRRLYRPGICRFSSAGGAAGRNTYVEFRNAVPNGQTTSGRWTSFPIGCCMAGCSAR